MNWSEWLAARTDEDGDCLIWNRCCTNQGMPVATLDGKTTNVRRWLLVQQGRPAKDGQRVTATCGNKLCMAHLKAVSPREVNLIITRRGGRNSPKAAKTNRDVKRAASTVVKTMEVARRIRALRAQGMLYREISALTGVPVSRCCDVANNKAWREHLPNASVFNMTP